MQPAKDARGAACSRCCRACLNPFCFLLTPIRSFAFSLHCDKLVPGQRCGRCSHSLWQEGQAEVPRSDRKHQQPSRWTRLAAQTPSPSHTTSSSLFFSLSFFFQGSVEFQTQTASEAPFARHCRRALDKFEKKVFELLSLCCHLARLCIAIVNRHPAPVLPTHQPRNESASRTPLLFLQCLDQTPTLCITPPPGTKHQSKIHSDDGIEPTAGYSPYGLTLGG